MSRQVRELVVIEELAGAKEEYLNLKSEWVGSKLPGWAVSKPKGTSLKAVREVGK